MAFTAPRTWTTSEIVTAAMMNEQVRDNVEFLSNPPMCHVYNSNATVAIANNTPTAVAFDTERYDTDSMHSTTSNPSRITFNTAGVYDVGGILQFATDADGFRICAIRLNGSTYIAFTELPTGASASFTTVISAHTTYKFAANDYVELIAWHGAGGDLNLMKADGYAQEFWATWRGLGT